MAALQEGARSGASPSIAASPASEEPMLHAGEEELAAWWGGGFTAHQGTKRGAAPAVASAPACLPPRYPHTEKEHLMRQGMGEKEEEE